MAKAAKATLKDDDIWTWMQGMDDKDKWSTVRIPPGDVHAPLIKRMSKNSDGSWTFYVYRNGKCLGATRNAISDKGLDEAKKLARSGKPNPKVAAEEKVLRAYIDDRHGWSAENFKKLSTELQKVVADSYPWAVPSGRKLEEAGVKKPLTQRTDLMNKHEKAAVKSGKYSMDAIIKITKKGNPKKEGSRQHMRWAICIGHNGKTVREMFAAGGDKYGIEGMLEAGYMELVEK